MEKRRHNWFLVTKFGQEPLRTGMLFIQHPSGEHSGCFPADTHSDPASAHARAEGSLLQGVTCQCPVQLNSLHEPPFFPPNDHNNQDSYNSVRFAHHF